MWRSLFGRHIKDFHRSSTCCIQVYAIVANGELEGNGRFLRFDVGEAPVLQFHDLHQTGGDHGAAGPEVGLGQLAGVEGVAAQAQFEAAGHEFLGGLLQFGLGGHEEFDGRAIGHQHQLEFLAGQAVEIVAGVIEGKGQQSGIIGIHMEAQIVRHGADS